MANCRWTSNKSYAMFQFTMLVGEERTQMGTVLIGVDAKSNELQSWAFWPDSQGHGKVTLDGKKLTIKANGKMIDGPETSADVSYTVEGRTLTIHVANSLRGDEEQPDMTLKLERQRRGRRQQRQQNAAE